MGLTSKEKEFFDSLESTFIDKTAKEKITIHCKTEDGEEISLDRFAAMIMTYISEKLLDNEKSSLIRDTINPLAASIVLPSVRFLVDKEYASIESLYKLFSSSSSRILMGYMVIVGFVINAMLRKDTVKLFLERTTVSEEEIENLKENENISKLTGFFTSLGIEPEEGFKRLEEEQQGNVNLDSLIHPKDRNQ